MRHLAGIVLAVALAAAVFFAASWGDLKLLIAPSALGSLPGGGGSLLHNHAVLEGFGALLGVGLVAGLLIAAPRISPLAAGPPRPALLARWRPSLVHPPPPGRPPPPEDLPHR